MHKILATAFIITLTTCYPVHAEVVDSNSTFLLTSENTQYASFDKNGNGYVIYESVVLGGIVFCEFTRQGDKLVRKCIDEN